MMSCRESALRPRWPHCWIHVYIFMGHIQESALHRDGELLSLQSKPTPGVLLCVG